LLFQAVRSAGHLSLGQALSVSMAPIASLAVWNAMSGSTGMAATTRTAVFAAGAGLSALALGTARWRHDLFESTPSIDTLGKRALLGETADLMFVVDDDHRIVRINEQAVDALGVQRSTALGTTSSTVLQHDTEELRSADTVTIQTTRGARQYDVQESAVTDHHGNDLGAVLSLRDVTDRELREERLAVMNRVLRHNLRNQADVVRGNAESLEADSDRVDTIIGAADTIAALGQQARRIDRYVSESTDEAVGAVDIRAVVDRVRETVGADGADVSVSVAVPASAQAVTNERALVSSLESALDNAVTYADTGVSITAEERPDSVVLRVADDGPGIPQWELDSLDTATETALEHSTGLGLWQLKWGVRTLNGELSFETGDGTTVEIVVPDRAARGTTTA
jgi:PAS domain S-box-containing protein